MGQVTVAAVIESLEDLYRVQRQDLTDMEVRRLSVPDALIDTGATTLSLPRRMIEALGLLPIRSRRAVTPTGVKDIATYGAVKLMIDNRDCVCDVTEAADECPVRIGQVPLDLMDFVVDPGQRRPIGNPAHGGEQIFELL